MTAGIYIIYCTSIDGGFYIGRSSNIENRWNTHKRELNKGIHKNKLLQKDWIKFGESEFDFAILAVTKSNNAQKNLERIFVQALEYCGLTIYNSTYFPSCFFYLLDNITGDFEKRQHYVITMFGEKIPIGIKMGSPDLTNIPPKMTKQEGYKKFSEGINNIIEEYNK